MMRDWKDFKARPDTDWEWIILIAIFLFMVVVLAVEWPREGAELAAQSHHDCDGPVMSMPIDMGRVRT